MVDLLLQPSATFPPAHSYKTESEHDEMPISTLETRSRIASFQSHASRRDREFLPFSLMFRDEIENFFPLVSCFETRSRISVFTLVLRQVRHLAFPVGSLSKYSQTKLWCFVGVVGFMTTVLRMISISIISKTSSLVKIVFLNFCLHFCQNVTFQQDTV